MFKESIIQYKIIKWFESNYKALVVKHIKTNINGFPDLQILMPDGRNFFIEVKTEHGNLSDGQGAIIGKLNRLNHRTFVLYGFDEDKLISILKWNNIKL